MESLNFDNIKLEKANAIPRYKKRQRVTILLFRLIEFCIFCILISRFSIQLPLTFKRLCVTLISPRCVFVLGNTIVIILILKSGHSSAKDGSTNNVKQKCSMNKEAYYEQSKKQRKQVILVQRQLIEKKLHRSHDEKSATVGCLKVIHTESVKSAEDEMSSEEFRKTVEAFIARQQRFLREEELFST